MHCLLASCTDPAVCGYSAILVGAGCESRAADLLSQNSSGYRRTLEAVTCSLGIAGFPAQGQTIDAVLKAADAALYCAKRDGRDRIMVAD